MVKHREEQTTEKAFYRTWSLRNPSAQEPLTVRVWGNYVVLIPSSPRQVLSPWHPRQRYPRWSPGMCEQVSSGSWAQSLSTANLSWPTLCTPLLVPSAQTSAPFAQVTYSQSSSIWSNPAKHCLVKIRDLQKVFSLWRCPACLEWLHQ